MPISLECPCGKALRVQDNLAGKKVKCPICGEILDVPQSVGSGRDEVVFDEILPERRDSSGARNEPRSQRPNHGEVSVSGKAAAVSFANVFVPSLVGRTTLTLSGDRLIEDTRKIVTRRHVEILVSQIDSAETLTSGNNVLMGLCVGLLIPTFGLSILLLPLYFIFKHRFLVIRSSSNVVAVVIKGQEDEYIDFLNSVLTAAAEHKR
jgi:hypothetical protein